MPISRSVRQRVQTTWRKWLSDHDPRNGKPANRRRTFRAKRAAPAPVQPRPSDGNRRSDTLPKPSILRRAMPFDGRAVTSVRNRARPNKARPTNTNRTHPPPAARRTRRRTCEKSTHAAVSRTAVKNNETPNKKAIRFPPFQGIVWLFLPFFSWPYSRSSSSARSRSSSDSCRSSARSNNSRVRSVSSPDS